MANATTSLNSPTACDHTALRASPALWSALQFVGYQYTPADSTGPAAKIEIRNCAECQSSLAIERCCQMYCRKQIEADGLCADHLAAVSIDDIEWLSRSECIVTWSFRHSGFVSTSLASVEFEGADSSVGINDSYFTADSDGPAALDELIAEAASLRDHEDDGPDPDRDWDSRADRDYEQAEY